MPTILAPLVLALLPQDQAPTWSPTSALVVSAADADRSGDVDAREWVAFTASLRLDGRQQLDRVDLTARLLAPLLDTDGSGFVSLAELEVARSRFDVSGDGTVDADEFAAAARLDGEETFVQELVLHLADGHGGPVDADGAPRRDGVTTADEWASFLAAQPRRPGGELLPQAVAGWIVAAGALEFEDRNAFSPDVYLLTLAAELDVDKDGALTPDDLVAHLVALDADGDGAVSAAELAPPPLPELPGARPRFERSFEEQRALPPLMPFQRSLEDAIQLVEATGKPLLVCVNMDGENASEELAWYRYRDPAFADLARGFVCVIASPDRRQPLDHDDRGRRLEDERFGRVVDAEAIEIEPELFERYFSGTRAAPRHVGVSPQGELLFDVFLVQDLSIVDRVLAEHAVRPGERPRPPQELSLGELLESPEHEHRAFLERSFVEADAGRRRELVVAALAPERRTQHPELVRLGLFDPDPDVRELAARVVASRPGAVPPALVLRALRVVEPGGEAHAELLGGLRRWALAEPDEDERAIATRYLGVFEGLARRSAVVDPERFAARLAVAPRVQDEDASDLDATIGALERVEALLARTPDDPDLLALYAEAALRAGRAALSSGGNPLFFFTDARTYAERAGERGLATLARAAWLLSDFETAERAAADALPALAARAETPDALECLRVLARTRARRVFDQMAAREPVDAALVADAVAAHAALAVHPGADEQDAVARVDLFGSLEAWRAQSEALDAALARFPAAGDLHARLRTVSLRDGGTEGLSARYADLVDAYERWPLALWFQGVGELFGAEHSVRARQQDRALAAYAACVEAMDEARAREASYADSSQHYAALALAGSAALHAARGDRGAAVAALEEAFARSTSARDARDGLGATPRERAAALAESLAAGAGPDDAALAERLAALVADR